jgi:hypothetical protein
MSEASTPEALPDSFTAGNKLITSAGKPVNRYGSVKQACAILDDCDRQTIYDLFHSKQIRGYKRNPAAANSHLRIDLTDVWKIKRQQLG